MSVPVRYGARTFVLESACASHGNSGASRVSALFLPYRAADSSSEGVSDRAGHRSLSVRCLRPIARWSGSTSIPAPGIAAMIRAVPRANGRSCRRSTAGPRWSVL